MFGSARLIKNADLNKNKYSGYGIGFNLRSEFLLLDDSMGKNIIIFRVDMNSLVHIDNKDKNILILGEGPT